MKQFATPSLAVIIPAFNEEKTIQQVIREVLTQAKVTEIIVVDDHSTDDTLRLARAIKNKNVKVITHQVNQGKGKAIQTALAQVKSEYVLVQDADLEYDPREIPKLLQPIESGRVKVVFGSRFTGAHTNMFYWHYLGNKFLSFLVNILFNTILSDMETCYKLMPTKTMQNLQLTENDFRIEPEITCKLLLQGEKIFEVPITYVGRTYSEGKKITWRDGFKAVQTILRIRFIAS